MGWLPEDWKKIILSIEARQETERGEEVFVPVGTAFLIDYETFNILVTVRHIVESQDIENLFISFNTKDNQIARIPLSKLNEPEGIDWFVPTESGIDTAIILFLIDFEKWDVQKLSMDMFETIDNLTEGDDVFFLGFPLGIKNLDRVHPLARSGMIARKNPDGTVIIDAHVFPGNSGSPVFLRPSIVDFTPQGVKIGTITPPKLIGIISSFLPYIDPCVSLQTSRQRITFEENSGLGLVFSLDYIINLIKSDGFQECLDKFREKDGTKKDKNGAAETNSSKPSASRPHTSCSAHITGVKRLR